MAKSIPGLLFMAGLSASVALSIPESALVFLQLSALSLPALGMGIFFTLLLIIFSIAIFAATLRQAKAQEHGLCAKPSPQAAASVHCKEGAAPEECPEISEEIIQRISRCHEFDDVVGIVHTAFFKQKISFQARVRIMVAVAQKDMEDMENGYVQKLRRQLLSDHPLEADADDVDYWLPRCVLLASLSGQKDLHAKLERKISESCMPNLYKEPLLEVFKSVANG